MKARPANGNKVNIINITREVRLYRDQHAANNIWRISTARMYKIVILFACNFYHRNKLSSIITVLEIYVAYATIANNGKRCYLRCLQTQ